jgi:hypothetical protein
MIRYEMLKYVDIYHLLFKFSEITGWASTEGGIWNADFSKPVFEVLYPKNFHGHVLSGESKYAFLLRNPKDGLNDLWRHLDKSIESLDCFLGKKSYKHSVLGEVIYSEIHLETIILWLMLNDELVMEDAMYHNEW